MIYTNKTNHIDMTIEYIPDNFFYKSDLVKSIYQSDNLLPLINSNLNNSSSFPILLTFLRGDLNPYYNKMLTQLIYDLNREISTDYKSYTFFTKYSYMKYILSALIDNNEVDEQFKLKLIKAIFNYCLGQTYGHAGMIYTSFLEMLYKERRTNNIPVLCLQLLFQKINFSMDDNPYSITNFIFYDYFLQYLTDKEFEQCALILLKKKGLNNWLSKINIGSYMWLLSKLGEFLPYEFTRTRLLPACKDKFNIGFIPILLKTKYLKSEDRAWLESLNLLQKLI